VAVGSSDTIRVGALWMVTSPLAATTVTGKVAPPAAADDAAVAADDTGTGPASVAELALAGADALVCWAGADVLLDDEQPVSAAAQAAAVLSTAASPRGVFIAYFFLPWRREGRPGRRRALARGHGARGRITLPTRVDIVWRAGVDLAWTTAFAGIVTVAGQRRNGLGERRHRLRFLARRQPTGG
jgi:hypothetical protein